MTSTVLVPCLLEPALLKTSPTYSSVSFSVIIVAVKRTFELYTFIDHHHYIRAKNVWSAARWHSTLLQPPLLPEAALFG